MDQVIVIVVVLLSLFAAAALLIWTAWYCYSRTAAALEAG